MVDLGFLVDCVSTYSPFWGWDGMELACLAVASSGTIIRDHYRRKHRRNFLNRHEHLIGKEVPYYIVGLFQSFLIFRYLPVLPRIGA